MITNLLKLLSILPMDVCYSNHSNKGVQVYYFVFLNENMIKIKSRRNNYAELDASKKRVHTVKIIIIRNIPADYVLEGNRRDFDLPQLARTWRSWWQKGRWHRWLKWEIISNKNNNLNNICDWYLYIVSIHFSASSVRLSKF